MFEAFYGLNEKPFNATPDPKFLFMTPSHREALAHLVFGVQEDKGFLVLTGEVGTGKTTLLNALLRKLDAGSTAVSFIYNSTLSFDEILEYMLKDFGVNAEASTRVQRLIALNAFLIEQRRAGRKSVVIFDEAQNRSEEHTSELQSHSDLVCRLLLEKKNDDEADHHRHDREHVRDHQAL